MQNFCLPRLSPDQISAKLLPSLGQETGNTTSTAQTHPRRHSFTTFHKFIHRRGGGSRNCCQEKHTQACYIFFSMLVFSLGCRLGVPEVKSEHASINHASCLYIVPKVSNWARRWKCICNDRILSKSGSICVV